MTHQLTGKVSSQLRGPDPPKVFSQLRGPDPPKVFSQLRGPNPPKVSSQLRGPNPPKVSSQLRGPDPPSVLVLCFLCILLGQAAVRKKSFVDPEQFALWREGVGGGGSVCCMFAL